MARPGAASLRRAHGGRLPDRTGSCYLRRVFPDDLDTILFDAGGTLVHVDYARVADLAERHGVAIDPARMPEGDARARLGVDARLRRVAAHRDADARRVGGYFEDLLLGAGVAPAHARTLAPHIHEAHQTDNLWRVPFADAARVLEVLRGAGFAIAVVSNADGRARALLDEVGLTRHLDYVLDSHEEGVEKPDPEIFRRALGRSGTEPERALYVGDIYSVDVVGARAAGLAPCLLDPLGHYADADCPRVANLSELAARLLGR